MGTWKCTKGGQVISHQLHNRRTVMAKGRETVGCESSQTPVPDQDVCGQPGPLGTKGTKLHAPLQADGFFLLLKE